MTPELTLATLQAEAKAAQKPLLILFSSATCGWCKDLKAIFEKNDDLSYYCQINQIELSWLTLLPKDEELAAETPENPGLRRKFEIASLPTAALFGKSGELLGTTEYIDEVETVGPQAYVDWMSPLLFPKKKTSKAEQEIEEEIPSTAGCGACE